MSERSGRMIRRLLWGTAAASRAWAVIVSCSLLCAGCQGDVPPYVSVKKAYRYLNEHKYRRALELFCQAYEAAPDQPEIKDHLVTGYIVYARACLENGDLPQSLRIVQTAAEVAPDNKNVIVELAYLYARKAIEDFRADRTDAARQGLRDTLDVAMRAKGARKSIANYLYNSGLEAYTKNEIPLTLECLRASRTLWDRTETAELLGEIYYRNRDYPHAREMWLSVKQRQPQNALIDQRLSTVEKEIALQAQMAHYTLGQFRIQFHQDYAIDTAALEKVLQSLYESVGADLGLFPPAGTTIIFYREDDFRRVFEKPAMVRGFYDGSLRIPLYGDIGDPVFIASLAHEYTHAVISLMTNKFCPVWLNEGAAVYEQATYMPVDFTYLKNALIEQQHLSIASVDEGFSVWHNPANVVLCYEAAYSLVLFMKDRWGWDHVVSLLGRFREGQHYANAIDDEFLMSFEQFEAEWNAYLRKYLAGDQGARSRD